MKNKLTLLLISFGMGVLATSAFADANTNLPFTDNFEAYTNGQPLIDGTNGWYGSSGSIVVSSNTAIAPAGSTNIAVIPVDCTLSNRFQGVTATNVWIWMDIRPSLYDGTNPPVVDTNVAGMFYINTNGNFVVHNGPATNPSPTNSLSWVTNTSVNVGTDGTNWVTVGILENFAAKTLDLYANNTLVTNNIGFINTALTNFAGFDVYNGAATSYLDNVSVSAGHLGGIGLSTTALAYAATYTTSTSNQSLTVVMTNFGLSAFTYNNTVAYGSGSGWLTFTPSAGTLAAGASQVLTGMVNSASLTVGVYVATNTITADATNSPRAIVVTLTVSKGVQAEISFAPASPQTCNTTNGLSASGGSGTGAFSYEVVSGPGVIVGDTNLWVTNATGTILVRATKATDANYEARSATGQVEAAKADQTITFPVISDQVTTNTVVLSATASSGLPVAFTVTAGPGVIASLTNLTFTGAGSVSIEASQAGDANWNAAPSKTNTFNVTKAAQPALIFTPPGEQVIDTTNQLAVSGGGGSGAVSFEVLDGPGQIVGGDKLTVTADTGVVTVRATKAEDDMYLAAAAQASVTCVTARIRYVVQDNPGAQPPYTNWATAAATIQTAVDAALNGDPAVLVSNGLYNTGGKVISGSQSNRVAIDKAIEVCGVGGSSNTTIEGASDIRCAYLVDGARLTGFTLQNGHTRSSDSELIGGGVLCASSLAVVSNCVITNCSAASHGGGVAQGTYVLCTIVGNSVPNSEKYGGGAYAAVLRQCTVSGNWALINAGYGGGVRDCTVYDSVISGNSAREGGGVWGGTLYNCTVRNNSAWWGAGVRNSTLYSCLIKGNNATQGGGGSYNSGLYNCTVVGNNAAGYQGGGVLSSYYIKNCIVYYNTSPSGPNYDGGSWLTYCCTTPLAGTGSITNEPAFVNYAGGDYKLTVGSPCVNTAEYFAWMATATDMDGRPRIMRGAADIGAYELRADQATLVFAPTSPQVYQTTNALAVSGGTGTGAVSYTVLGGPGQIVGVSNLWVTNGTGIVTVRVDKADDFTNLAASATGQVVAAKATQASLVFAPASPQIYNTTNGLSASGGSGTGALSYAVQSGPGVIVGDTNLWVTNVSGTVVVRATKAEDENYNAAFLDANVNVDAPITITSQPASRTNAPGSSASFTVGASSAAPLYYQWRKGGSPVVSATNATYTFTVATNSAGSYACLVSNMVNTATSDVATLTVNFTFTNNTTIEGDLVCTGPLIVAPGVTLTIHGSLTLNGGSTLGAGATLVCDHLYIPAGSTLTVSGGTLTVAGATINGSFTLTDSWGTLTILDDFIVDGGTNTWINSHIVVSNATKNVTIESKNGAVFTVSNCLIEAASGSSNFAFIVRNGTTFSMTDTTNMNCGFASASSTNWGLFIDTPNAVLQRNEFTNNYMGVVFGTNANGGALSRTRIQGNASNTVNNTGSTTVDARSNWWGTAISSEIAASIAGPVIYDPWYSDASMTQLVTTAQLLVTALNQSRAYGATNPVLTYKITDTNDVIVTPAGLTGAPVVSTTADVSSVVGSYVINCSTGTLAAPNCTFTAVNGELAVTRATHAATNGYVAGLGTVQTCTVDGVFYFPTNNSLLSLTWLPALPTNWVLLSAAGDGSPEVMTNGSVRDIEFQAAVFTNPIVFRYTVSVPTNEAGAKTIGGDVSYDWEDVAPTIFIRAEPDPLPMPQALMITANGTNKTYGATVAFAGTEFATVGLNGGDTVTNVTLVSAGATSTATVAGSPYSIVPSAAQGTGLTNYIIVYNNGALTVYGAALTVTANNDSKTYGQTRTYGSGLTNFTSVGLQNGETIATVTITPSGGTESNAAAGSYNLTPSAATPGTFNPTNYAISYNNGTLTVNALPVNLYGTRPYNGTATAEYGILSVINAIGTDVVTVVSGSAMLASALEGTWSITNMDTLVLGGAQSNNYTLTGASGSVTITGGTVTQGSHTCVGYYSPTTTNYMVVSNLFEYPSDKTLTNLVWSPILPTTNWTLNSAAGDGSPSVAGTNITFGGPLTNRPVKFTYQVNVPGNEAVSNSMNASIVFAYSGGGNQTATPGPLTIYRYHSADYKTPKRYIDTAEVGRVLAYWRTGNYRPNAVRPDGYEATTNVYTGPDTGRHSADYKSAFWQIDTAELGRVLAYWRTGSYSVGTTNFDGYKAGTNGPGPM